MFITTPGNPNVLRWKQTGKFRCSTCGAEGIYVPEDIQWKQKHCGWSEPEDCRVDPIYKRIAYIECPFCHEHSILGTTLPTE